MCEGVMLVSIVAGAGIDTTAENRRFPCLLDCVRPTERCEGPLRRIISL